MSWGVRRKSVSRGEGWAAVDIVVDEGYGGTCGVEDDGGGGGERGGEERRRLENMVVGKVRGL